MTSQQRLNNLPKMKVKQSFLPNTGQCHSSPFLDSFRTYVGYTSFAEYSQVLSPEGKRVITLMHNNGKKVSIWLSQNLISFLNMIKVHAKIILTDNAILIEV